MTGAISERVESSGHAMGCSVRTDIKIVKVNKSVQKAGGKS
jgi:hypothetical protein